MIAEWNIRAPSGTCAASGRVFEEGETIASALFWRNGAYERLDYVESAWPPAELPPDLLSSWKSAYKAPVPPPPEALNKNDAEGLLRHLLASRDPAQSNACYILALMLERKRIVKEIDRREVDGNPVLIYEHLTSGETWIIPNPALRLDEMEQVQTEVARLLGGIGQPGSVGGAAQPAQ